MVRLTSPEVAVTVSVEVPAGVPLVPLPPGGGGASSPPPPQEAQSPAKSTIVANPIVAILRAQGRSLREIATELDLLPCVDS